MSIKKREKPEGLEVEPKNLNELQKQLMMEFLHNFRLTVVLKKVLGPVKINVSKALINADDLDEDSLRRLIFKTAEETILSWFVFLKKSEMADAQKEWKGISVLINGFLYAANPEVLAAICREVDKDKQAVIKQFAEIYFQELTSFWSLFEMVGAGPLEVIKAENKCLQKILAMNLEEVLNHDLVMDMVFALGRELFPDLYKEALLNNEL